MIMKSPERLTVEQFADRKLDFAEGGRWTELIAGQVVHLDPPDDAHGNFIRNLSRVWAEAARPEATGYFYFEPALVVTRSPDTIRSPAAAYFRGGPMFAELDQLVSEAVPVAVVEVASTNDRRRTMPDRAQEYLALGVQFVCIADTHARQLVVLTAQGQRFQLEGYQTWIAGPLLDNFQCLVGNLFAEPEWWVGKLR